MPQVTIAGKTYDLMPIRYFQEGDINSPNFSLYVGASPNIPYGMHEITQEQARDLYKQNPEKVARVAGNGGVEYITSNNPVSDKIENVPELRMSFVPVNTVEQAYNMKATMENIGTEQAPLYVERNKVQAAALPQQQSSTQNIPEWVKNLSQSDLQNPAVQISLQNQGIDINSLKGGQSKTQQTAQPSPTTPQKTTTKFTKSQSDSFNKTPNLDKEQIVKTFQDYGYQPSETELKWWMTQPNSTYTKLTSGLQKKKKEEVIRNIDTRANEKKMIEQQQGPQQQVPPEAQRYLDSHPGETYANIPSIFKGQQQGSTTPQSVDQKNKELGGSPYSTLEGKTKLYPLGKFSLIKFDNSPTVFLVDINNKELRPFLTWDAFVKSYPNNLQEAKDSITIVPSREQIQPGGAFNDFNVLSAEEYGISGDKPMKEPDFRVNNISKHYGQKEAPLNQVVENMMKLNSVFTNRFLDPKSGLDSSFVKEIMEKKDIMGFYLNAIIHGGYNLSDIYKDLSKRQAQDRNNTQYDNSRFIDDTMNRDKYYTTPQGKVSLDDVRISVPESISSDNKNLWNTPAYNLPADVFKAKPGVEPRTDEQLKADANKMLTDFHYVATQKLKAQTESEKIIADREYENFRKDAEKQLGIRLSANAQQAWNQLQDFVKGSSEAGLAGSGLESEQIDDYLKAIRLANQQNRDVKIKAEEESKVDYYRNYASPEQIKKLDEEDAAKGLKPEEYRTLKWGIKPSKELIDSLDSKILKSKYPHLTDEEIENYRNEVLDENKNLRSNLYAKQYAKMNEFAKESMAERIADERAKDDLAKKKETERILAEQNQRAVEDKFSGYYKQPSKTLEPPKEPPPTVSSTPAQKLPEFIPPSSSSTPAQPLPQFTQPIQQQQKPQIIQQPIEQPGEKLGPIKVLPSVSSVQQQKPIQQSQPTPQINIQSPKAPPSVAQKVIPKTVLQSTPKVTSNVPQQKVIPKWGPSTSVSPKWGGKGGDEKRKKKKNPKAIFSNLAKISY